METHVGHEMIKNLMRTFLCEYCALCRRLSVSARNRRFFTGMCVSTTPSGTNNSMRISLPKTRVTAFRGCYPVLTKLMVDDYSLEQLQGDFQYLRCNEESRETCGDKLSKFTSICGMIQWTSKLKLYQKHHHHHLKD